MGFSGKKWEVIGDRGIYRNYGRYTLSWGLLITKRQRAELTISNKYRIRNMLPYVEFIQIVMISLQDEKERLGVFMEDVAFLSFSTDKHITSLNNVIQRTIVCSLGDACTSTSHCHLIG